MINLYKQIFKMRTKYFLIAIITLFATISLTAQNDFFRKNFDVDTITDAGTIIFDPGYDFTQAGQFGFYAVADSLSGSTDATAYIEVAPYGSTDWIVESSYVINGVQTIIAVEDRLYASKIRMRIVGAGTQSTKVKPFFTWFRDR